MYDFLVTLEVGEYTSQIVIYRANYIEKVNKHKILVDSMVMTFKDRIVRIRQFDRLPDDYLK